MAIAKWSAASLVAVVLPAAANDTLATLGAGGLTPLKSSTIVMESEDLEISVHQIAVRYIFRNTGDRDVKEIVAFPLPELAGGLLANSPVRIPAKNPLKVIQTREGLPDSDPDILCEVVDGVWMPFVDTRNAPYHPGMGLDDLFQLHHAGDDAASSKCILPLYVWSPQTMRSYKKRDGFSGTRSSDIDKRWQENAPTAFWEIDPGESGSTQLDGNAHPGYLAGKRASR